MQTLRTLSLLRSLARAGLVLVVLAGTVAAQGLAGRPLTGAELAELSLSAGTRMDWELPGRLETPLTLELPADGGVLAVELEPVSLRTAGFRLLVPDPVGGLVAVSAPRPMTVGGRVQGLADARVGGSLRDGRLWLSIARAGGADSLHVQPLTGGGHAIHRGADVIAPGLGCGPLPSAGVGASGLALQPSPTREAAVLALDADHELYQSLGGSLEAVVADVESLVAGVAALYEVELDLTYLISTLVVRTTPDDPYTTTDAVGLLNELRDTWNSGELAAVERAAVHLFTDRELNGPTVGVAFLDALCDTDWAYGLSQVPLAFSQALRVSIPAHELGHNWSANHCDGTPDCATMCSGVNLCGNGISSFGAQASAAILAKQAQVSCLDTAVLPGFPDLVSLWPASGPASGGTLVELFGSDFPAADLLEVLVDGVAVPVLETGSTRLLILMPPGPEATSVDVRVQGGGFYSELGDGFRYDLVMAFGDTVKSALASDEVERHDVPGLAGELVTLKVQAQDGDLALRLRLLGVLDDPLVEITGAPGQSLALKKVELPFSGPYHIEVEADGGNGPYRLRTRSKPLRKKDDVVAVVVPGGFVDVPFSAAAGTVLRLAEFRQQKPKEPFATVEGQPSALIPSLLALSGPDGVIDLDSIMEVSANGLRVRVRNLLLETGGNYTLRLGGVDGSVGYGRYRLRLRPPKPVKEQHEL